MNNSMSLLFAVTMLVSASSIWGADIPVAPTIKGGVTMVYEKYEKDNQLDKLSQEFKESYKKLKAGATRLPAEEIYSLRQDLHVLANYNNVPGVNRSHKAVR